MRRYRARKALIRAVGKARRAGVDLAQALAAAGAGNADRRYGRREPQEDTPCLEDGRDNCNDAGTGEGRFHGRI